MLELKPEYLVPDASVIPYYSLGAPDVVSFGFGVTYERMIQYAFKAGIIQTTAPTEDVIGMMCEDICVRIKAFSGAPQLDARTPIHDKYNVVIVLYDNYSKPRGFEMDRTQEEAIVQVIRRELQVPKDEKPMWYFDAQQVVRFSGP